MNQRESSAERGENIREPTLRSAIIIFLACIVAGVVGVFLTALVFDAMNWCCFHGWAMLHGSAELCFLFWAFVAYHVAKRISKHPGQFSLFPNLAYISSTLGTYGYLSLSDQFMWSGVALCGVGVYRRVRHAHVSAAGLMWSAVWVSYLAMLYTLRNELLWMRVREQMGV